MILYTSCPPGPWGSQNRNDGDAVATQYDSSMKDSISPNELRRIYVHTHLAMVMHPVGYFYVSLRRSAG